MQVINKMCDVKKGAGFVRLLPLVGVAVHLPEGVVSFGALQKVLCFG